MIVACATPLSSIATLSRRIFAVIAVFVLGIPTRAKKITSAIWKTYSGLTGLHRLACPI
jgi:hypothetical protein